MNDTDVKGKPAIKIKGTTVEEMLASAERVKKAAQRILEVSAELHLTWYEFEETVDSVKRRGYVSSSPGNAPDRIS